MAALRGVKTLDMVDGEITKVAYEGAEYESAEGGAKVGDIIRLTEEARHDVTPGGFYTVRGVRGVRVQITDDVNEPHHWDEEYYDLFRKKHVRLKVGDYAQVVDEGEISITGDIVKITEDDHGNIPFRCDVITGKGAGDYFWAQESELVLATEAEVATAKEAEAKRSIEAKWAKIGRKVDEYKVGDIVAYDDRCWFGNSGIGEVSEGTSTNYQVRVAATDRGGVKNEFYLNKGRVTLITPVEARFDRS
ncbi:hypothetical protein [Bacillus pumilus]|uniref:hypothetical protein n=1 Tax=Bacillus pumilus TaxID=1408 RepID=UPI0011A33484|nr:hypothetical protein [Bacillus pumilus]